MELRPPQYPLSREEFRRALVTGHGRARIHVARFGAQGFREEILEAASVCKVYDPQSEGTRADWLAQMVLAAGVEREIVALSVPSDYWEREHLAALLKELAVHGISGAREALYACFGRAEHSCDVHAIEQIVALDGEAGFIFVARTLGAGVADGGGKWISSHQLSLLDEVRGEGAARELLESLAPSDVDVRAFLDAVERDKEDDREIANRPSEPRKTIEQVLEAIRTKTQELGAGWVRSWGMRANRDELEVVLCEVLALSHPRAIEAGLRCLGGAGLPPLLPRIFELTRHEDTGVRSWAARVLSKHSLPAVHDLGLETLARGDLLVALEILTRSALVGDARDILAAVAQASDDDDQHGVCYGMLDVLQHCPEVVDPCLALFVYGRTPCSHCREQAVRWLCAHRELPDWVAEECMADASAEIRDLAARPTSS